MIPAGALAGGILSEHIGVRAALVVAGIGSVLSAAPLVLSRLGSVRAVGDICEDRVEHA
jgi:predicted MFS family arabinose efflux permease